MNKLKILVRNFQSLYSAGLEVSGLTVVTGPSDMGKSALVRAVEAALFHRSGDEFVSEGELCSEVYLGWEGDDPFSLVWKKGWKMVPGRLEEKKESINEFIVNGVSLKKVGRSQPVEVANLGFREIDYDGLTIPLQIRRQRGVPLAGRTFAPFVLGFSSTDAEKVLARIVQTDEYSIASKMCAKDGRDAREKLAFVDEELASSISRLHVYKPLAEIRVELDGTTEKVSLIDSKISELEGVEALSVELGKRALVKDVPDYVDAVVTLGNLQEVSVLSEELSSRFLVVSFEQEMPSYVDNDVSLFNLSMIDVLFKEMGLLNFEILDSNLGVEGNEVEISGVLVEMKDFKVCPLCENHLEGDSCV